MKMKAITSHKTTINKGAKQQNTEMFTYVNWHKGATN